MYTVLGDFILSQLTDSNNNINYLYFLVMQHVSNIHLTHITTAACCLC